MDLLFIFAISNLVYSLSNKTLSLGAVPCRDREACVPL